MSASKYVPGQRVVLHLVQGNFETSIRSLDATYGGVGPRRYWLEAVSFVCFEDCITDLCDHLRAELARHESEAAALRARIEELEKEKK